MAHSTRLQICLCLVMADDAGLQLTLSLPRSVPEQSLLSLSGHMQWLLLQQVLATKWQCC